MIRMNKLMLTGYVGADPEIKEFKKKDTDITVTICTFPIAVNSPRKNNNVAPGAQESTSVDWYRVAVFHPPLIEKTLLFKKGDYIFLEGELQQRETINSTTGEKKMVIGISILSKHNIQLVKSKHNPAGAPSYDMQSGTANNTTSSEDNDFEMEYDAKSIYDNDKNAKKYDKKHDDNDKTFKKRGNAAEQADEPHF